MLLLLQLMRLRRDLILIGECLALQSMFDMLTPLLSDDASLLDSKLQKRGMRPVEMHVNVPCKVSPACMLNTCKVLSNTLDSCGVCARTSSCLQERSLRC